MITDVRLWAYLTELFVEWEMFQTKGVEKIETFYIHIFSLLHRYSTITPTNAHM
jgi:hypothetical protein